MSGCSHPGIFKGICIQCGVTISTLPQEERERVESQTRTPLVLPGSIGNKASSDIVLLSEDGLEMKRRENTGRLLRDKRLALVLDLDHTLVHATDSADATQYAFGGALHTPNLDIHNIILNNIMPNPTMSMNGTINPPTTHLSRYTVAIRPGTREFLQLLAPYYELSVITMGNRLYADAVVALLDPDRTLIRGRVVSRDELPEKSTKTMSTLSPCDEDLVTILDDRTDVWGSLSENVIKLLPYHFFINASEAYDRTGFKSTKSAADSNNSNDETKKLGFHATPQDNVLASLIPLFLSIHSVFYAKHPLQVVQNIIKKTSDSYISDESKNASASTLDKFSVRSKEMLPRYRMDVDNLPRYIPNSSSNSTSSTPSSLSSTSNIISPTSIKSSLIHNIQPLRVPLNFYANMKDVYSKRDIILKSYQDVKVLLSSAKKSVFSGVRLAFTCSGFDKPRKSMYEYHLASEFGASNIDFPDFSQLISSEGSHKDDHDGSTDGNHNHNHDITSPISNTIHLNTDIYKHDAVKWDWNMIPTHVISTSSSSDEAKSIQAFNEYCKKHRIYGPHPKVRIVADTKDNVQDKDNVKMSYVDLRDGKYSLLSSDTPIFQVYPIDLAWILASTTHFVRQPEELFAVNRADATNWITNQPSYVIDPIFNAADTPTISSSSLSHNGANHNNDSIDSYKYATCEADHRFITKCIFKTQYSKYKTNINKNIVTDASASVSASTTDTSSDLYYRCIPIGVSAGSSHKEFLKASGARDWAVLKRHGVYSHSIASCILDMYYHICHLDILRGKNVTKYYVNLVGDRLHSTPSDDISHLNTAYDKYLTSRNLNHGDLRSVKDGMDGIDDDDDDDGDDDDDDDDDDDSNKFDYDDDESLKRLLNATTNGSEDQSENHDDAEEHQHKKLKLLESNDNNNNDDDDGGWGDFF